MTIEKDAYVRLMNRDGGPWGLRDYQREAVDAVLEEFKRTTTPAIVTAATGAGKSWMIAGVALATRVLSAKAAPRILVIQPSAELVRQNFDKLAETGIRASRCSASVGDTSVRNPIVYGTPRTLITRITPILSDIVTIIVDECEHDLSTTRKIIDLVRTANPRVRVVGFTATPYITGQGYVYAIDVHGNAVPADQAVDPYFGKQVYDISARLLIDRGCLTEPVVLSTGAEAYETDGLVVTRKDGRFSPAAVQAVYAGSGRKTALIVADLVERTVHMRAGLIFAATIEHAEEVARSMPAGSYAVISSRTKKADRIEALARFRSGKLRWLINVDILTRGFDAPVADHVALLRKTESAGLLQQIIGRVLRVAENKPRAYILDYAGNIDAHFPDDRDIFDPQVKAVTPSIVERISFFCESCGTKHDGARAKCWDGADADDEGYVIDYAGKRLTDSDTGLPLPVHMTRRCHALIKQPHSPQLVPCGHWFAPKECDACGHNNDVTARLCGSCGHELIDPNDNLRLTAKAKVDPTAWRVTKWTDITTTSRRDRTGKPWFVVYAEGAGEFWFPEMADNSFQLHLRRQFDSKKQFHDGVRWRVSTRNSKFKEFGGWAVTVACKACEGSGSSTHYSNEGAVMTPCLTCMSTGVIAS